VIDLQDAVIVVKGEVCVQIRIESGSHNFLAVGFAPVSVPVMLIPATCRAVAFLSGIFLKRSG
jgi:hypothetical protein